jgi:hypothetical protein
MDDGTHSFKAHETTPIGRHFDWKINRSRKLRIFVKYDERFMLACTFVLIKAKRTPRRG